MPRRVQAARRVDAEGHLAALELHLRGQDARRPGDDRRQPQLVEVAVVGGRPLARGDGRRPVAGEHASALDENPVGWTDPVDDILLRAGGREPLVGDSFRDILQRLH